MDEIAALHRACFWLCALIEAFGVEPDTTTMKATISSGDELANVNLADDLRAFQALGVNVSVMDDFDREEHA
jgi:hypothetical protein